MENQFWKIKNFIEANQDKPDFVIRLLNFRQQQLNKDTIIIICGEKRTGKSYSAIKIAEALDSKFDVDTGVFFDTKPFLIHFRNAKDNVFVLDEVSVNYDARSWFDIQHKIFNTLLTTQGFRRNTLILTLPTLSHLDKRVVHLAHYVFSTMRQGNLKCYKIQTAHAMGKAWLNPFSFLNLELPSKENVEKYELMKKKWNDDRLDSDIESLQEIENPENKGKKFSPAFYVRLYRDNNIDEFELKENLSQLDFKKKDIEMLVFNEADKKLKEAEKQEKELSGQVG